MFFDFPHQYVHGQRSTIPVLKTHYSNFENFAGGTNHILLRSPSVYSEAQTPV